MLAPWMGAALAYLGGSIPTAHLVGKAHGIDLRTVGSGNLGATNVFRTLGWKWGVFVYVVDFLKGAAPIWWLVSLAPPPAWLSADSWVMLLGVLAIVGHVRPVFLLGRGGGKGVATASGVFIGLAPVPAIGALATFAVTVAVTRYVSLGSILGGCALAIILQLRETGSVLAWLGTVVALFVIFTHRENLTRLRRGEERRIGGPKGPSAASTGAVP